MSYFIFVGVCLYVIAHILIFYLLFTSFCLMILNAWILCHHFACRMHFVGRKSTSVQLSYNSKLQCYRECFFRTSGSIVSEILPYRWVPPTALAARWREVCAAYGVAIGGRTLHWPTLFLLIAYRVVNGWFSLAVCVKLCHIIRIANYKIIADRLLPKDAKNTTTLKSIIPLVGNRF